jgi:hypothetical protein
MATAQHAQTPEAMKLRFVSTSAIFPKFPIAAVSPPGTPTMSMEESLPSAGMNRDVFGAAIAIMS